MNDLIDRLSPKGLYWQNYQSVDGDRRLCLEAAEEITRLRSYLAQAAQYFGPHCDWEWDNGDPFDTSIFQEFAVLEKQE